MFSFIPLYRLRGMRPVMILRKEKIKRLEKWPHYLSAAILVLFFFGVVLWHMQEVKTGMYFVGGTGALIAVAWAMTHLMLWGLRRLQIRRLTVRQAARGLFRPGNATKPVMVTLTASLTAIFVIFLIEQNLDATFVKSYPPDSPNVFFLDIQPHQQEAFSAAVDQQVQYFPVIRAKVVAVNGQQIDRSREREKRRDNLSRMFNLTYRQHLLADEKIVKGAGLFRKDWQDVQVSIMDTVTEMHKMDIGDTITFKIQGVPLKARIASIRSRDRESFSPFFYFVFEKKVLEKAPQSIFTALRVEPSQIGSLRSRIVSQFPNISVIDLSESLQVYGQLLKRLSGIIRFFSLLSIAAGILILVSAIFATRAARIAESVYYKILGAKQGFVLKVFAIENLLMTLLSGLLALLTAQSAAYLSCRFFFDIPYRPFAATCLLMLVATLVAVVVIGLISSVSILAKKPVTYLREQTHA
jgi:putative ABC transport system permease protein